MYQYGIETVEGRRRAGGIDIISTPPGPRESEITAPPYSRILVSKNIAYNLQHSLAGS